ncbi:MAG: hypothetical protein Q9175_006823 [Cornicularia normoerica]
MLFQNTLATLFCFQLFHTAIASTNDTIVSGWVNDPDGRGTFTIASSCVLTLSLCVYTAIHLNVRPYRKTELQSWIETTKWVVFGILAPELVVFVAWRQYVSAMALDRIVRGLQESDQPFEKSLDQTSDDMKVVVPVQPSQTMPHLTILQGNSDAVSPSEYRLHNPWTRTHSFYANMGGFVFDLEESCPTERNTFTAKHSRLTVTPRGMALLARCGFLPKISKEDILDKSKSDNMSKMISVVQALWMLAQIIGRLIIDLPVTLLEVNTLAHIMCAMIIYILWWDKPKLINEPTKLHGDWVPPVSAYMYMSSQISGWRKMKPGILKKDWIDPEFSILALKPSTARTSELARPISAYTTKGESSSMAIFNIKSRLESSQELQTTRWPLAAEAMTLHSAIACRVIPRETQEGDNKLTWVEPITEELVDDSIGNWATGNLLRDISGFVMGMVVWSASMAYGGLHATAWNGHFPSRIEMWLWRASSICVAGSGLTWILINMLARTFKGFKAYWERVESLRAHWTSLVGLGSLATLFGLAYLLARIYLVVEAFISLRRLPAAAFETAEWTQLVPHL